MEHLPHIIKTANDLGYHEFHCFLNETRRDIKLATATLDLCAACRCCADHQKDKPHVYAPWREDSEPLTSNKSLTRECKCTCRQLARFVCRMHPDSDYERDGRRRVSDEPH